MTGDYEPDDFTENDVLRCLEQAGLEFKNGTRYILSQCPQPDHEDKHASVQIYKDDWFVNCHAGCGRYHITKTFPELLHRTHSGVSSFQGSKRANRAPSVMTEHVYKTFDLTEDWKKMELLPEFQLHGVPSSVLNDMGWRKHDHSIFIPYFSASQESIPFAQYRHLQGNVRFTMLKDAKPTMYGIWNLDNPKLFLVEGTSDAAVLQYAQVPWIAAPSAASGALVRLLAGYCKQNGIELVFAGDNDAAGLKLRQALDEVMAYRVKQPPTEYKDWGEFLEATDIETITNYCFEELFGKELLVEIPINITEIFPDAEIIIGAEPFERKELSTIQPQTLL